MTDADDHRRWREITDAVRFLNATDDAPPMSEIRRIAERHAAKPSDVLDVQRVHKETGIVRPPSDMAPHITPRTVDLTGLDRLVDLPQSTPGTPTGSPLIECERCGTPVHPKGVGAHQRGPNCTHQTAAPDTAVTASVPPEGPPTGRWGRAQDPCGAAANLDWIPPCVCGLPVGHDGPHLCREPNEVDSTKPCNLSWTSLEVPVAVTGDDGDAAEAWIDIAWPVTPEERGGLVVMVPPPDLVLPVTGQPNTILTFREPDSGDGAYLNVTPNAGIAPLSDDEQLLADDLAQTSGLLVTLAVLGDGQWPDPIRELLEHMTDDAGHLHTMVRDHHRTADLVAERAVLAARLAEIDAALDTFPQDPLDTLDAAAASLKPEPETRSRPHTGPQAGPQMITCGCGEQVKHTGVGPHRTRSKVHAAWAATRDGAA